MVIDDFDQCLKTEWDVIVIGGGTVGIYFSVMMARMGKKVLVLEGGGRQLNEDLQSLNRTRQVGMPHTGSTDARARAIGGTSLLWGGQLAKFSPRDLATNPQWLVSHEELSRYYDEVSEDLNVGSLRLGDNEIYERKYARNDNTGTIQIYYTHWLKETNVARYFAQDIHDHPNLSVALNVHVLHLGASCSSRTESVMLEVAGERKVLPVKGANVVLANGTLEISRLLLLSAKYCPELGWSGNDNVGRYFQDHIDIDCGAVKVRNEKGFRQFFESSMIAGNKIQPRIRLNQDMLIREPGLINVAGSLKFHSSLREDIDAIKVLVKSIGREGLGAILRFNGWSKLRSMFKVWFPLMKTYLRHRRIHQFWDGGVTLRGHMEQQPERDSRLTLSTTDVDRFGMPILDVDWRVDWETQLRGLKRYCDEVKRFFDDRGVAELQVSPLLLEQGEAYLRSQSRDSYHQCGGAVMGDSPEAGVVDRDLKVHGSDNTYVIGAAVFPSSSYANPTLTAFALAKRLARHFCG